MSVRAPVRSRSSVVIGAAVRALERVAREIDGDDDLRSVDLSIKVRPDGTVRAVVIRRESETADDA